MLGGLRHSSALSLPSSAKSKMTSTQQIMHSSPSGTAQRQEHDVLQGWHSSTTTHPDYSGRRIAGIHSVGFSSNSSSFSPLRPIISTRHPCQNYRATPRGPSLAKAYYPVEEDTVSEDATSATTSVLASSSRRPRQDLAKLTTTSMARSLKHTRMDLQPCVPRTEHWKVQ